MYNLFTGEKESRSNRDVVLQKEVGILSAEHLSHKEVLRTIGATENDACYQKQTVGISGTINEERKLGELNTHRR